MLNSTCFYNYYGKLTLLCNFGLCNELNNSIFVEEGEVFVWGFGILGKGPKLSESAVPERVPATFFGRSEFNPSVKVSSIRCGLNHFAAVTGKNVMLNIIFTLKISSIVV